MSDFFSSVFNGLHNDLEQNRGQSTAARDYRGQSTAARDNRGQSTGA